MDTTLEWNVVVSQRFTSEHRTIVGEKKTSKISDNAIAADNLLLLLLLLLYKKQKLLENASRTINFRQNLKKAIEIVRTPP